MESIERYFDMVFRNLNILLVSASVFFDDWFYLTSYADLIISIGFMTSRKSIKLLMETFSCL